MGKSNSAKSFTTAKMVGADDDVIENLMKEDPVATASLEAVMADMTDWQVDDIVDGGVKTKVLAVQAQKGDAEQAMQVKQILHKSARGGTDINQKIIAHRNLREAESNWQKANDKLNENQKDIDDHKTNYP